MFIHRDEPQQQRLDFSRSCSLVERRRSTVKMSEMKTNTLANSGNFAITELTAVQIYESDTLGDSVSDGGLEEESCYYSWIYCTVG